MSCIFLAKKCNLECIEMYRNNIIRFFGETQFRMIVVLVLFYNLEEKASELLEETFTLYQKHSNVLSSSST